MSRSVDDWKTVYEPLLGDRLGQLWFYPLGCDTPDVVRDLQEPVISFSGAVGLRLDRAGDLYLTWRETGCDCELSSYIDENGDWTRESVDRVRVSPEDPWGKLLGGQMSGFSLYSSQGHEDALITTVAHHLRTEDGEAVLWVSTGSKGAFGAYDDMVVTVDRDLTDPDWQTLVGTIQ